MSSDNYRAWEKSQALVLWAQSRERSRVGNWRFPIGFPVNVAVTFFVIDDRRRDITNSLEGVMDALVKAGVLYDDNYKIVASIDNTRMTRDYKAHVEIEITARA